MMWCLGCPTPEVLWLQNGKEIQESEDFHFESKGNQHSLLIQEVFPEDTGTYTCEAWNEVGETRTEASLTVQGIDQHYYHYNYYINSIYYILFFNCCCYYYIYY